MQLCDAKMSQTGLLHKHTLDRVGRVAGVSQDLLQEDLIGSHVERLIESQGRGHHRRKYTFAEQFGPMRGPLGGRMARRVKSWLWPALSVFAGGGRFTRRPP